MSNEEPDLLQIIENIRSGAIDLYATLRQYESRIAELQSQISQAELYKHVAEKRAAEAQENYKKAIELQTGQYQQLIRELFDPPKAALERSIKSQATFMESTIRKQSRFSNVTTVLVAVVSVVIGIAISWVFQKDSSETMDRLVMQQGQIVDSMKEVDAKNQAAMAKFDNTVSSLQAIEGKTDFVIENMALSNPQISKVVDLLNREKANLRTKNDLLLAYRFKISPNIENLKYEDYIKAFNIVKLPAWIAPSSPDELRHIDTQYIQLCKNAMGIITAKNGTEKPQDNEVYFGTYKASTDPTEYNKWKWTGTTLTYSDLFTRFQGQLNIVQKQVAYNQ